MVFKLQSKLAGKPNAQGTGVVEILTTTTTGNFRITPAAGIKMGIGAGDYVFAGIYDTGNNTTAVALTKCDKDTPGGSKVGYSAGKDGTGSLSFSCAVAYAHLGGNEAALKAFTVGDAVQPTDEAGKVKEGENPAFVLTFLEDRLKQVREKKAKVEGETAKDPTAKTLAVDATNAVAPAAESIKTNTTSSEFDV